MLMFCCGLSIESSAQNQQIIYCPDTILIPRDSTIALSRESGDYDLVFDGEVISRFDPPRLGYAKYGKWVYFRRNGFVKKKGYWYSGNRVGVWVFYRRNNKEYKRITYEECGKAVKIEYFASGKIKIKELKTKKLSSVEKQFGKFDDCVVPDHVFLRREVIITLPAPKASAYTKNGLSQLEFKFEDSSKVEFGFESIESICFTKTKIILKISSSAIQKIVGGINKELDEFTIVLNDYVFEIMVLSSDAAIRPNRSIVYFNKKSLAEHGELHIRIGHITDLKEKEQSIMLGKLLLEKIK